MPVDMNKTIAEASLDNLHDIIVPEAIGFFPPAPGWYVVGLLVLALLFHFGIHFYKQYQKSLYKREALAEFCQLGEEYEILDLMKRVAIYSFGREKVASLTGDEWWNFIEKHSEVKVYTVLRNYCNQIIYDSNTIHDPKYNYHLREVAKLWIKMHKVTKDV